MLDKWLKPVKDEGGAYHVDAGATQEAQAVVSAALVAEGQAAMDLPPAEGADADIPEEFR